MQKFEETTGQLLLYCFEALEALQLTDIAELMEYAAFVLRVVFYPQYVCTHSTIFQITLCFFEGHSPQQFLYFARIPNIYIFDLLYQEL